MSTTDPIKQRIRLLLNLAENDGATEGEIDNALRFARRLMDAHHLSEDDIPGNVHDAAAEAECKEMARDHTYGNGASLASWEKSLATFTSAFVGGVGVYLGGPKEYRDSKGVLKFDERGRAVSRGTVVFYGLADEVQLATALFDDLRGTIAAMARLKFGGALRGDGRSYGDGFVSGLYERVKKFREEDKLTDERSRALVVRSAEIAVQKRKDADAWLKNDQGVKLRSTSRRNTIYNGGAYSSGQADGRKANVAVNRQKRLS